MDKETIASYISETINGLKDVLDVDMLIGKPISNDDGIIIPVSKLSFGFLTGNGENQKTEKNPFIMANGGGASIIPVGFLVIREGFSPNFVKIEGECGIDKWLDILKNVIENLIFKK